MGYTTKWDESFHKLEEALLIAKNELKIMIDSETYGFDEIREERIEMYENMYLEIIRLIKKINSK